MSLRCWHSSILDREGWQAPDKFSVRVPDFAAFRELKKFILHDSDFSLRMPNRLIIWLITVQTMLKHNMGPFWKVDITTRFWLQSSYVKYKYQRWLGHIDDIRGGIWRTTPWEGCLQYEWTTRQGASSCWRLCVHLGRYHIQISMTWFCDYVMLYIYMELEFPLPLLDLSDSKLKLIKDDSLILWTSNSSPVWRFCNSLSLFVIVSRSLFWVYITCSSRKQPSKHTDLAYPNSDWFDGIHKGYLHRMRSAQKGKHSINFASQRLKTHACIWI